MNGTLNYICDPETLKQQVSGLSVEWILKQMYENESNFAELTLKFSITDVEIIEVSCHSGFMANVYRAIVTFENGLRYKFIMKIPSVENFYEMMNKIQGASESRPSMSKEILIGHMERFHNKECAFYEMFPQITGFPTPKVYFAQKLNANTVQHGVLLMEDLSESGKLLNILNSYSIDSIKHIVECIASFHAYFLSQDDGRWRNKFLEINQIPALMLEGFQKSHLKLARLRPGLFGNIMEKLEFVWSEEFMRWCFQGCCEELGLPSILNHGDVWSNNMLWKMDSDGSIANEIRAFFDLQLTFEGNPAIDMTRVIVLNTDPEARKELETFIFDHYMYYLKVKMREYQKELPEDWTVDMIKKAYYVQLPCEAGLLTTVATFFLDAPATNSDKRLHEAKIKNLIRRTKHALEDAYTVLKSPTQSGYNVVYLVP